ncbi:MAG: transglycosylase domain-containing protein [Chitinophagales bacterium]|jgi:penicillin-binding protein 1A
MLDLFKSVLNHPIFRRIQTVWQQLMAPVRSVLAAIWAPIQPVVAPMEATWQQWTAPLRARWSVYRQQHPLPARVVEIGARIAQRGLQFLLALILLVWMGIFGHMPNREELRNIETANSTEIYSADSVLIGKYYIENRTAINLSNISPYVVTALLATEDKRFFEHSGIDLTSWLRAVKGIAMGNQETGGGSTLSQQLAKNLYPRRNYWIPGISMLINKIKENIISIKLEGIYNKEELLNLYLNTVPFGGDRYGINVAAKYFFNKKAKDLTAEQAATLIGMLKATTALDPLRNPQNSTKRRNLVLRRMLQNQQFEFESEEMKTVAEMIHKGKINEQEYEVLIKKPLGTKKTGGDGNNEGTGTYFREYLRTTVMPAILKNISKEDGSPYNLYRDGLKIYTTVDAKMQQYAEEAVEKHMKTLQGQFDSHWKGVKTEKPWGDDKWIDEQVRRSDRWQQSKEAGMSDEEILASFEQPVKMTIFSWKQPTAEVDTLLSPIDSVRYYFCTLNCGFMAMEHATGKIKAWVGGTNFRYFKYDHIQSKRQVGSTFKPIVYAAALQDSVKPCSFLPNELVTLVDWTPHNADEVYGGWYSVIGGLTQSVNVIAAQLIEKAGIQKTIDLAKGMGITSTLPREYGISLGAAEISLFEMVKAYGTIANGGLRPEPVTVLKVVNRNGEVIYDYQEELKSRPELGPHVQALNPEQAEVMTKMMQNVIERGTGRRFRSYVYAGEFAGKTGTTQNQSDGWFVNFNPTLVTGAWVGGPSRAVRFRSMSLGQGSAMALPIVGNFWNKVAGDRKYRSLLEQSFELSEATLSACSCPNFISVSPDTLYMLMQDSTIRDSLKANRFENLQQIVEERFGKTLPAEPEGVEGIEGVPDPEIGPSTDEKNKNRSKELLNRLLGRDPKEKKPGGGR